MIKLRHRSSFLKQTSEIEDLIRQLRSIREDMMSMARDSEALLQPCHTSYRASARNLLHYLALRTRDIRQLQVQLAQMGLSSLGRTELAAISSVDAVLHMLHQAVQRPWMPAPAELPIPDFQAGRRLLEEHTEALLGPAPQGRSVRIMVTMPSEAADNYMLVYNLLQNGMNCMRINCAHDNAAVWTKMIANLRRAEQATRLSCKIMMDLAGPKLRTGAVAPKPAVMKIRPLRNDFGELIRPARVWLTAAEAPLPPMTRTDFSLPVEKDWLAKLAIGDHIKLQDARKAVRTLKVVDVAREGCLAEAKHTAYIVPGTVCTVKRDHAGGIQFTTTVGILPAKEGCIRLKPGDLLIVEQGLEYGKPASLDQSGKVLIPAAIGCHNHEVFEDARSGEPIFFDDGKIGGMIERTEAGRLYVRITQTRAGGHKLRGDKGINLPNSSLRMSAMTSKDAEDLAFIASHADIVALSFANRAEDVRLLREHLDRLHKPELGIVLKIETRRGFENLPSMLLEVMKVPCCGVMIARGDLAVECGFERMAEVQEEMLWICEAAHVPAIWATQVLESMAKEGIPSRAEVTDAAMGEGAECIMLNKGTHIIDTVKTLDNIIRRMQGHQNKKRPMMRKLSLASSFREKVLPD